jgi:hypothetical protein
VDRKYLPVLTHVLDLALLENNNLVIMVRLGGNHASLVDRYERWMTSVGAREVQVYPCGWEDLDRVVG